MSENARQFLALGEFGAQVLPDLFVVSWLGMCRPQIDCHVYVLRGSEGLLLIDCGTPWGFERIRRNMAHWGLDPAAVRTVLCTHSHVDHVSGGYHFKAFGAEFLGHFDIFTETEMQWEAQGILDEKGCPYRMDGTLADGDHLQRCGFPIEVLHTPGHTSGCLSFLIPVNGARCLFSGDLVMSDGLPGYAGDPGHDDAALVAGLKRLAGVRYDHLCHGHDVILNDRGRLFSEAVEREARGDWLRDPVRCRPDQVPGRVRADANR